MIRPVCWLAVIAIAMTACGDGVTGDGSTSSTDDPLGALYPVADLAIVVEHPAREILEYRLTCLGDTATVTPEDVGVDEQAACMSLADDDVVSRLVDGPPGDRMCTEIYGGPDVATITGTIDDRSVDTAVDRTNGCGIADWDQLLSDLLPAAVGIVEPSPGTSTTMAAAGEDVFGWLRSFETGDGATIVRIDQAEMLSGEEAVVAAREAGVIGADEDLPNDYFIRNPDESTTEFTVSPDAIVVLQACYENGPCVTTETVDLETWSILLGGEEDPGLDWLWYGEGFLPYVFTVVEGTIVEVAEVYLP